MRSAVGGVGCPFWDALSGCGARLLPGTLDKIPDPGCNFGSVFSHIHAARCCPHHETGCNFVRCSMRTTDRERVLQKCGSFSNYDLWTLVPNSGPK